MHYNPFAYLRTEKDILKLVNTIIVNTKGEGAQSTEDFWVKAERLYYTALIGYIHYEAPEEEKNFITLLDMINASDTREDDEDYKNPVDLLFDRLEEREPEHFAVKQYRKYKLAAGQTTTNRYIGYLPDVPEFYPFMTAAEYLHFCGEITGMKRTENEERCKDLLELVGLGNETHHIKGFSRGMKQRLGIAQALLNRPKLLICDEPTSALDPVGRKEILDILLAIREQTTVLFSTHILSDVERICTDVAFLNNGVVGVQGKLSDIKTRYRSEEYQLETGNDTDMLILQQTFPNMQQIGRNQLVFCEGDYTVFDILRFIADKHIALLKLERAEPTLESLFMEVVEK